VSPVHTTLKFIYLKVWPTQPSDCPEMENPALSSPFRGTLQLTAPLSSYGTSVWMATPNVGDVVSVRGCLCTVKYVGSPRFADGVWVGVAFDTAIGRNDGMVEGISYFKCPPRHGLFVRPSQVLPSSAASSKVERDAPEEHVQAWKVQENVMEIEAIQAGRDGARVLKHLESNFPAEAGGASPSLSRSKPLRPSRRGPGVLGRQGSGTSLAGTTKEGDLAAMLLARYGAPPARYNGPSFSGTPTPAQMVELCDSIKRRVAHSAGETAVAAHVAITLMAGVKEQLEREAASVVELNITDGRIVVVGDTHGQLNDFCWILKVAHASTRSRRAATAPRSRRAAQRTKPTHMLQCCACCRSHPRLTRRAKRLTCHVHRPTDPRRPATSTLSTATSLIAVLTPSRSISSCLGTCSRAPAALQHASAHYGASPLPQVHARVPGLRVPESREPRVV